MFPSLHFALSGAGKVSVFHREALQQPLHLCGSKDTLRKQGKKASHKPCSAVTLLGLGLLCLTQQLPSLADLSHHL